MGGAKLVIFYCSYKQVVKNLFTACRKVQKNIKLEHKISRVLGIKWKNTYLCNVFFMVLDY